MSLVSVLGYGTWFFPIEEQLYCCRIWDQSFREQPDQRELRVIVPLVLYQGERSWSYSSEFADLFAESVRDWPGVPRFSHGLIDQSGLQPDEVQGELKAQLMQLVMLAAYHPALAWMERVARLLGSLSSLPPSGGINYVRIFVGCVANFAQEVVKGQWPLFAGGIRRPESRTVRPQCGPRLLPRPPAAVS